MKAKKNVILIDVLNVLYRAYYGLPEMKNDEGLPTNALFGFTKSFLKLIKKFSPCIFYAFVDSKGSRKRTEIYPEYKAQRKTPTEDFLIQKQLTVEFLHTVKIPIVMEDGYEADDLLAAFVNYSAHNNPDHNYIIVSSDKDAHFLLFHPNVTIYDPLKDIILDHEWLKKKYIPSATKEKILLYYAITGDASDNIPGIKGIGTKGALSIIEKYLSIEEFLINYEHDETLKARTKILITEHKETLLLSYQLLSAIDFDIETYLKKNNIGINYMNSFWEPLFICYAKEFFTRMSFASLIKIISEIESTILKQSFNKSSLFNEKSSMPINTIPFAHDTFETIIYTNAVKEKFINEITNASIIAMDTETTGCISPLKMVAFSLCTTPEHAWFFPLYSEGKKCSIYDECLELLHFVLKNKEKLIIFHNASFDLHVIADTNSTVPENITDSMIIAFFLYGSQGIKVGLKNLSYHFLKEKMLSFSDTVENGKYTSFDFVPLEYASKYAAADARQTLKLYLFLHQQLLEKNLLNIIETCENPLIKILFDCEQRGIPCNETILNEQATIIEKKLTEIHTRLINELKILLPDSDTTAFNPLSSQQVSDLLFNHLNIEPAQKTNSGKHFSTNRSILKNLKTDNPINELIAEYRTLHSIMTRNIINLKKYIKSDGKIHTYFQQTHVVTGRLSTMNPNLQNIPRNSSEWSIRKAFTASEGYILLSSDYSQIELRILAELSGDSKLREAFKNNIDVHMFTAMQLFSKSLTDITDEERTIAKRINFSIVYGMNAFGLAQELNISRTDAKTYLDEYKKCYHELFHWIDTIGIEAIKNSFVETYFGRKRYFNTYDKNDINFIKRAAVNTIIQGTAAEIIKKSMINVDALCKKYNGHILLQIHDELLLEIPTEKNISDFAQELKNNMEIQIPNWTIPITVNIKAGPNWGELQKICN